MLHVACDGIDIHPRRFLVESSNVASSAKTQVDNVTDSDGQRESLKASLLSWRIAAQ